MAEEKYAADDIKLLTLRDSIRKRPAMYIGSTGRHGVEQLVWELTANSVDQVLAGQANHVQIVIHDDDSIEVLDDGPGLDLRSEQVRSHFLENHPVSTADSHASHVHPSNLGTGLVVANALSSRFRVTTSFKAKTLRCEWTDGGENGGSPENLDEDWVGTSIRMWLDGSILDDVAVRPGSLDRRIHELNALIPDLSLIHI